MTEQCPTCKRPFRPTVRKRCAVCGQAMGHSDKYRFREDGRIEHRLCDYPDSYLTPEQIAALR